jgi:hypothetical protein
MERVLHPWLYPDFIYYKTARGRRFKELIHIMHDFNNSVSVCNKEIGTPQQPLLLQRVLLLTDGFR